METVTMDDLDRSLLHALEIDARAPFHQIAAVLGVSDQTVARRYRRLRSTGTVRVVALPDTMRLGHEWWVVRIQCTPDGTAPVAEALARRPDTAWVALLSGGTEIACAMKPRSPQERDTLLLQKLPRTNRVVSWQAHFSLHLFVGGPIGWPGRPHMLTEEQQARLAPPPVLPDAEPVELGERDDILLGELAKDGRTGYPELAAATGWSESTVKRRLELLRRTGTVFFDMDLDSRALGYTVDSRLWMSVPPARLAEVGAALATHPEVAMAAAITGTSNLIASVVCRDPADFYRYVTTSLGALPAIERLETTPVIRHVKRAGAFLPIT